MASELANFLGKEIVIDTKSQYVYIGVLEEEGEMFLALRDVDVHDRTESPSTKEVYIMEALKYGIKVNRRSVKVMRQDIISISLLSEVVLY